MRPFLTGRELNARFYREAVRPILDHAFRGVRHAAGLLGPGSDVLGYDTPMSTDHDWGPRLTLALEDEERGPSVAEGISERLPRLFLGYPTGYQRHDDGTLAPAGGGAGPTHPRIEVGTVRQHFRTHLGFDPERTPTAADWLTFSEQRLLSVTALPPFHDEVGWGLVQSRFGYYPDDVWLYLLASTWTRVGQEEHLVGRGGQAGDELGAKILAARIARDLMRLAFLMSRRYAPYPKWFGTAFGKLPLAGTLGPALAAVLRAEGWEARDAALADAYRIVAEAHNGLGVTEPLPTEPQGFYTRPFRVIHLHGEFAPRILASIQDPEVRRLAERRPIGSVDTFSDSTDLLVDRSRGAALRALYEEPEASE